MAAASPPYDAGALEALMLYYRDAGVDTVLDDLPVDRFAESAEHARRQRSGHAPERQARKQAAPDGGNQQGRGGSDRAAPHDRPAPSPPQQMRVPDKAAFEDARAAAAGADTLEALKQALETYTGCNLRHSARSTVFADGNPEARLMIVGEAPGRDEDLQGLPFVGRAGQLLDRMLLAIGLDRQSAYITNVLAWRPPGNRTPTPHEIELCRPFVERHIALVKPEFLLLLGNVSVKTLLHTDKGILSIRGTLSRYERDEMSVPAMPSLHPAYLLRSPAHKRQAWADLLALKAKMDAG